MPRGRRTEIPSTIERSDKHAREIWQKTHDSAVETYGEGEAAHRVAFASLKHQYKKEGDRWVKKARKGPSDPQAARGPATRPRSTDEPAAPTAGGKVARTAAGARTKAREAKREDARARLKRAASSKK
jgi:cation transport regulator ChaB